MLASLLWPKPRAGVAFPGGGFDGISLGQKPLLYRGVSVPLLSLTRVLGVSVIPGISDRFPRRNNAELFPGPADSSVLPTTGARYTLVLDVLPPFRPAQDPHTFGFDSFTLYDREMLPTNLDRY